MKKQLFSAVAALAFGSAAAQVPSPSWSITQNANFTVTSAGTRYLDAVDANVVWACGYDGTAPNRNYNWYSRTINGGTSWTSGNIFADTNTYVLSNMEGVDANTAWVCAFNKVTQGNGGVFKTVNGGTTWSDMTAPTMFTNANSFANIVSFLTPNNGIAQGDPINNEFEIWTTSNAGTSWTQVPGANIPNPLAAEYAIVDLYDKFGPNHLWFGTNKGRVYYTTNAGTNWSVTALAPAATSTVTEIAFASVTNGLAYVAVSQTSVALYNTTDGGLTWNWVNTTDPDLGRNDLAGIPGTNNFASVDNQNTMISYSTDNGQTWTSWGGSQIPYIKVDFVDVNTAWAGSFSDQFNPTVGGIWKYTGVTSNFSLPTSLCKTLATVTVSPVNLSTGVALTYSWTAAASVLISSATATTPVFTFSNTGIYTITLTTTNNLGVVVNNTQQINVLTCTTPTANFNLPGNTPCNNVAFTISNSSIGTPAPAFTISAANATITNPSGPAPITVKFATPGVYTITSTASNAMGTGVTSKTVNVNDCSPIVNFGLDTTVICLDGTPGSASVAATNSTTGSGVSYVWSITPNTLQTVTVTPTANNSRRFSFSPNGGIAIYTITLVATNVSGSNTMTATVDVLSCVTGLNDQSNALNAVFVYPNPASEQLNVSLPASNDTYKVKMINVIGAVVFEETVKSTKETVSINVANQAKGVYFLSIENGGSKAVKKIIVD